MNDEIIAKINGIAATTPIDEAHVQHLFTLVRKLTERVPEAHTSSYSLLKFYCDWTVHSKIDRSREGALVIQRIHNTILNSLSDTIEDVASELTATLSLSETRNQLNDIIHQFGGSQNTFSEIRWNEVVPILLEIISHCELEIGSSTKLTKTQKAIQAKPLKGSSVVTTLSIIKVPTAMFGLNAPKEQKTFCMLINTTDTTKFIVPIIRSI